jgi:hypothetical protein
MNLLLDLSELVSIALKELYRPRKFFVSNNSTDTIGVFDSETNKFIAAFHRDALLKHLHSVCDFVDYLEKRLKEKL